jgi:hypothetical protein
MSSCLVLIRTIRPSESNIITPIGILLRISSTMMFSGADPGFRMGMGAPLKGFGSQGHPSFLRFVRQIGTGSWGKEEVAQLLSSWVSGLRRDEPCSPLFSIMHLDSKVSSTIRGGMGQEPRCSRPRPRGSWNAVRNAAGLGQFASEDVMKGSFGCLPWGSARRFSGRGYGALNVKAVWGFALAQVAFCEGQGQAHDPICSTGLGSASVDDHIGCGGVSGGELG